MNIKKIQIFPVILALIFFAFGEAHASRISRAFEALSVYDYFKAKDLFYKSNKRKADAYACYGLATIFRLNDNPFHNIDSALRYVHLGWQAFKHSPDAKQYAGYTIDSAAYRTLADSVCEMHYRRAARSQNAAQYDAFLRSCYLASADLRQKAIEERDEIEYFEVASENNSEATRQFIFTHPGSVFQKDARALLERQLYEENTQPRNASSYLGFLRSYPGNRMTNQAYEKLYDIYLDNKDVKGLALFINEFPDAPQNLEAWKLLFSLSVKSYSYAELKKFLDKYPRFPLRNTILNELELNKLVLYPFGKGDYVGYINEAGEMLIPPVYYDAGNFHEGLAIVQHYDSVSFINKENKNPFRRSFENAGRFRNGIAPVKDRGQWYFINRLGQKMSDYYEEISELSDNIYVVKLNGKYGAVDQFGQTMIEPHFEKLGDFTNDMAYYTRNGKYGFVSVDGRSSSARFDWISSFSPYGQAVVKIGDLFGLISDDGRQVLEAVYEQILKQNDTVYLVVRDEKYGFFHADGCFIYFPESDYIMSVQSGRFCDGSYFKLTRKLGQAIGNRNGMLVAGYTDYEEVYLPSAGLMRVRKRNKYGFADMKNKVVIPYKFEKATDFSGGRAVVVHKEKFILIDRNGEELFSSREELLPLGRNHLQAGAEPATIIDLDGKILYSRVHHIQEVAVGVFAFEHASGKITLFYDSRAEQE